jgi:antitoxin component HigA of HigAB toxin-antitoxin module
MAIMTEKYRALMERFPLNPLRNESELNEALDLSVEMHQKFDELEPEERGYLDILSREIERYEEKYYPVPAMKPHEYLKELLKQRNLKQTDLQALLGVHQGRASELINGIRDLTKNQIMILSTAFNVPPSVFLPRQRERVREIKYEPSQSFIKIEDCIKEASALAKETGNIVLLNCNDLKMSINKNSEPDKLIAQYRQYAQNKGVEKRQIVTVSIKWFE